MTDRSDDSDEPIRAHVFDDDIREYDKLMPNWWLTLFWSAVAFAFGYWIWTQELRMTPEPAVALEKQVAENQRAASSHSSVLDDDALWALSADPKLVQAGAATFAATCSSCHMPDLRGGIGPNLLDQEWIHGGNPLEIVHTISSGVLEKGMPSWAPILGEEKIREVAGFILSHHKKGEPIVKVNGWTPIVAGVPAAGS